MEPSLVFCYILEGWDGMGEGGLRRRGFIYSAFELRSWRILFFLLFVCLYIYFFTLQYCIGFAIHWHESAMGAHEFPNPEPLSHLPPHIISLGHPSIPAPSILYSVSNLDWRFVSYMIVYMFQCHSSKSSHPLPLPQSPKVCSLHLCLLIKPRSGMCVSCSVVSDSLQLHGL